MSSKTSPTTISILLQHCQINWRQINSEICAQKFLLIPFKSVCIEQKFFSLMIFIKCILLVRPSAYLKIKEKKPCILFFSRNARIQSSINNYGAFHLGATNATQL